jgi:RNA polymerase sigma-70 factor, ECF subfamily
VANLEGVADEQLLATYVDTARRDGEREAAFRELVGRYQRRVFAVCWRVLGSTSDAEDATQETFVRLARNAASFRGEAKLSTWLYRVAHNVCTDRLRYAARRPVTSADETALDTAADPHDEFEGRDTAMAVQAALATLDERSRTLLLLVAVDGLSYAEAAEASGLPVGTVKSRVSRARVRLGTLLADATSEPVDGEVITGRPESIGPASGDLDPMVAPRGPPEP